MSQNAESMKLSESTVDKAKDRSARSLPSIEQLIKQGQPQFGVFAHVEQINYLDYHSHLISQRPVAEWRKQLKANQFAFIQLVHEPYRICIAVATIKLATTAFAYIYNEDSEQLEIVEALQPLMLNAHFSGDHQHGEIIFTHQKLSVTLNFSPEQVSLRLNSNVFTVNADLQRGSNPLSVCSPSGRRGWSFTQKEPFVETKGELILHQSSKHYASAVVEQTMTESAIVETVAADSVNNVVDTSKNISKKLVFNSSTHANLDWTLGFMRHETNWFWSCINTKLSDQRQFMLNLSMGVNETGVSENACWIDGQIYYLPPVMFRRAETDKTEVWHISHQNLGWSQIEIDLTFTPLKVYKKTDNYGVIASIFEQWIGLYSGQIKLGQQTVTLDKVMGLAEDHFAKW